MLAILFCACSVHGEESDGPASLDVLISSLPEEIRPPSWRTDPKIKTQRTEFLYQLKENLILPNKETPRIFVLEQGYLGGMAPHTLQAYQIIAIVLQPKNERAENINRGFYFVGNPDLAEGFASLAKVAVSKSTQGKILSDVHHCAFFHWFDGHQWVSSSSIDLPPLAYYRLDLVTNSTTFGLPLQEPADESAFAKITIGFMADQLMENRALTGQAEGKDEKETEKRNMSDAEIGDSQ